MIDDRFVVIDTGPARELAHNAQAPDWVSCFTAMKADGFRFSLADHAGGELINQRHVGSITDDGFTTMIGHLETFLDPELPIMLGDRDIFIMIGASGAIPDQPANLEVSRRAWSTLVTQRAGTSSFAAEILEEDRADWRDLFQRTQAIYEASDCPNDLDEHHDPILDEILKGLNNIGPTDPPLSLRLDLKIRYFWRQFVRSKKAKEAYNVEAPKKRNDGIDFGLYTYLALPALAVAIDNGFFSSIASIPSFQTKWIYKPASLAEAWKRGDVLRPIWPLDQDARQHEGERFKIGRDP